MNNKMTTQEVKEKTYEILTEKFGKPIDDGFEATIIKDKYGFSVKITFRINKAKWYCHAYEISPEFISLFAFSNDTKRGFWITRWIRPANQSNKGD